MSYNSNTREQGFTQKEIVQIKDLLVQRLDGYWKPIDGRKVSRNVRQWARHMGIIAYGADIWELDYHTLERVHPGYVRQYGTQRLYITADWRFHADIIPPAALYLLVAEKVFPTAPTWENDQHILGYSVGKARGWTYLDIWNEGTKGYNDDPTRAREDMATVLFRLDSWDYVSAQMAGNVWWIEIRDRWDDWKK